MYSNQIDLHWGSSGTSLVFLHYFGGAANSWQWVAQALRNEYQCVALNLPGFGNTPPFKNPSIDEYAHWIVRTLDNLKIKDPVLVGHSMSGKFALNTAAMYPNLVSKVILVAPSPPTYEPMKEEERERMLNHPSAKEAETTAKQSSKLKLSSDRASLAIETQLLVDHPTWRWWLSDGMNQSISNRLNHITIPILLLTSKDDPVIDVDFLTKDLQNSALAFDEYLMQEAGHLLPLEAPERVAEHIKKWLAQIDRSV